MPVIALPGVATSIAYVIAAGLGITASWYFGNWVAGWINEFKNSSNSDTATDGRTKTNTSNQKLNDQISHLKTKIKEDSK